jgi:hypothetical protein
MSLLSFENTLKRACKLPEYCFQWRFALPAQLTGGSLFMLFVFTPHRKENSEFFKQAF